MSEDDEVKSQEKKAVEEISCSLDCLSSLEYDKLKVVIKDKADKLVNVKLNDLISLQTLQRRLDVLEKVSVAMILTIAISEIEIVVSRGISLSSEDKRNSAIALFKKLCYMKNVDNEMRERLSGFECYVEEMINLIVNIANKPLVANFKSRTAESGVCCFF